MEESPYICPFPYPFRLRSFFSFFLVRILSYSLSHCLIALTCSFIERRKKKKDSIVEIQKREKAATKQDSPFCALAFSFTEKRSSEMQSTFRKVHAALTALEPNPCARTSLLFSPRLFFKIQVWRMDVYLCVSF